jgi:hypothetical protein
MFSSVSNGFVKKKKKKKKKTKKKKKKTNYFNKHSGPRLML